MTKDRWTFKMTPYRLVLFAIVAVFLGVAAYRLLCGLGAATNLSDEWPWGLWIGFDVLTGVAIAGGGFSTAFIVHILHKHKYEPIARAALLTSLIGYLLVMGGLFFDIGRYYNFWRPFVYWGHHSVLFEVFWCVSLYTTVQVLEFGSIAFERIKVDKLKALFDKMLPALFIFGIMLPTLHQSSLGSLYIITIDRLYPTWWSMLIPVFFLTSAVFVGPAMVTFEGWMSSRAYKRDFAAELPVLSSLVKVSAYLLLFYFALKVVDLTYRQAWPYVFNGTLQGNLFIVEILVGILVPMVMYFIPSIRNSVGGIVTASFLVVAGVIFNRMNVVFTGMAPAAGGSYFPHWMEWSVTIGLVATGILVYCFVVENFAIFHEDQEKPASINKTHRYETAQVPT
ncbi:MAG: Ni/Fe-hydrogenase cytochrome b subunit [Firmicutes bacterium]|nr:Ni/Fe-hydrogenase cytochrome b subunit [Bacillota bacterium]MBV1727366.1 Ni/Fe-hydrogenase cytochrome b subunit [Desulforudis sp.]MBU4533799.1 Ni/Fe-hydrogenase cytochrome b subunit [Bacillota bacterium]MBU4555078.1 Ni/Fe-hydrogenase cytochrome b subunit [Bacillota bacterium]MBV1735876.1 Ni/Fe-hydrogenase cytochrome b subunit [Desulforudis sp.]